MDIESIRVKLTGVVPLLLHSDRLVNSTDPIVRKMKAITSKPSKKRTDSDMETLADLEWLGSLYTTEPFEVVSGRPHFKGAAGVPAIKSTQIEAALIAAAKNERKGKDFQVGLFAEDAYIPLEYTGSKDIEKLMRDPAFRDIRSVVVQKSRTMRTRPKFAKWSVTTEISYYPSILSRRDVETALERAGRFVGIGDYRPRYGRFEVEFL